MTLQKNSFEYYILLCFVALIFFFFSRDQIAILFTYEICIKLIKNAYDFRDELYIYLINIY